MANLAKIEFTALDISGKNYLSWILDAEIHLDANGLGNTIKKGNAESAQNKAKAMNLLRRHLHEGLKVEYLTVKDPLILWNNLKESGPKPFRFFNAWLLKPQHVRDMERSWQDAQYREIVGEIDALDVRLNGGELCSSELQ
ncbi:hypothetical protein V6N13_122736 [Hibiscus sabdariffa]